MKEWVLIALLVSACDARWATPPEEPSVDPPAKPAEMPGARPGQPSADPPADPAEPTGCKTFEEEIEPIFTGSCASSGCHGGAGAAEGLRLDAGYSHVNLVDVPSRQSPLPRVAAGDPSRSYLLEKLGSDPSSGSSMPLGRALLGADAIAQLTDWIAAGAPRGAIEGCDPSVDAPEAASIEIAAAARIEVGETVQLGATVLDAEGNRLETAVRWINEREPIAYLDAGGSLIGTAPGIARVRAEAGAASASIDIEVVDAALPAPSYETEVVPLLTSRCALSGCHVHDGDEPGDIAFDEDARSLYYDLVDREAETSDIPRVSRFDLERSFLWLKITRSHPPAGEQMPPTGGLFTTEEVRVILRWISSGAYCEC